MSLVSEQINDQLNQLMAFIDPRDITIFLGSKEFSDLLVEFGSAITLYDRNGAIVLAEDGNPIMTYRGCRIKKRGLSGILIVDDIEHKFRVW